MEIDTDPGVDDALAILLALASPEIEILAYVVSFGNTDLEASYLNIFKIYQAVGRHIEQHPEDRDRFPNYSPGRKPFVVKGSMGPLSGELHNAAYFHGRDGLSEITQSHPEFNVPPDLHSVGVHPLLELSDRPGHQVAFDILRDNPPRSVTYIRIGRVVIMGGAFDVPGNVTPSAEFNFFADPFAVAEVLTSADTRIPPERVLLLPLDITGSHFLPFATYSTHVDPSFARHSVYSSGQNAAHALFQRVLSTHAPCHACAWPGWNRAARHCRSLGRDCAPAWVRGGRSRVDRTPAQFEMERTGELTRGMCVVDRRNEGAHAPTTSYAKVQETLQNRVDAGFADVDDFGTVVPAPRRKKDEPGGVPVVEGTPGPESLVQFLLKRVWNIEATKESLAADQLLV
ncbi:Inosine/uridine-preferring nucleoside hydrolase domain-containing protein [Lactarius quietus]|nr:Inosine/uridine-preferring nucleoside hydrolase domain-containing protein [Lactarius quietus]